MRPLPNTAASGAILLVAGLAASALVHVLNIRSFRIFVAAITLAGASLALTGLAKLVHGSAIRIGQMTPLLRAYAVAAAALGVGHLFAMGYFRGVELFDVLVVVLIVGVLCFGGPRPSERLSERRETSP